MEEEKYAWYTLYSDDCLIVKYEKTAAQYPQVLGHLKKKIHAYCDR